MPLDPPLLRAPLTRQTFDKWAGPLSSVRPNDTILSCAVGSELFQPKGCELHSWDFLGNRTTLDFPSAFYDVVYLNRVLEHHDWDSQKKLVREGLRVLKPGGELMACSVACNDQEELFKFAVQQGFDTERFETTRLSNRCIAQLKPTEVAFFQSMTVIPNRKRFVEYLHEQGFPTAKLENCWTVKGSFAISRLHCGLRWTRAL